jgi:hypothetical protein
LADINGLGEFLDEEREWEENRPKARAPEAPGRLAETCGKGAGEEATGQGMAEAEEGETMNDELGRQILEQIRELQTTANTCCYTLITIAVMVGVIVWRLHS